VKDGGEVDTQAHEDMSAEGEAFVTVMLTRHVSSLSAVRNPL
jgi:hypothetical protein